MKIGCPQCHQPISAAEIDLELGIGHCRLCEQNIAISDQISEYPVKAQLPLLSNPPVNSWTRVDSSPQLLKLHIPPIPVSRRLLIVLAVMAFLLVSLALALIFTPERFGLTVNSTQSLLLAFLVIFGALCTPILFIASLWNSRASRTLSVEADQIKMIRTSLFGTVTRSVLRNEISGIQVRNSEHGTYKVDLIIPQKSIQWPVRDKAEANWIKQIVWNHLANLKLKNQRRDGTESVEDSLEISAFSFRADCPYCHQTLDPSHIQSPLRWAKCSSCDQIFSLKEGVRLPPELNVTVIPSDVDVSQQLKTTKLEESSDSITLYRGKSPLKIGTVLIGVLLTLVVPSFLFIPWLRMVPWTFVLNSTEPGFGLPRSLLLFLTCLVSILMLGPIGLAFWGQLSSYETRIDQESLTVIRRSIGFVHSTTVPRSTLFCVKRPDPPSNLGDKPPPWSIPIGIEFVFDDRRFILPMADQPEADLLIGKINHFLMQHPPQEQSVSSAEVAP